MKVFALNGRSRDRGMDRGRGRCRGRGRAEAKVEAELEAEVAAKAVATLLFTSLCPTVLLQSALSFRCIPLLLANQFPIMPPVKHFTCLLPLSSAPSFSPSLASSHFLAVARVHLH